MTDADADETRTSPPTRRPLLSPRQRDVEALYASTHHQRGADDDGDGDAHPENQIGQRRCSAEERARCAAETATVMKSSTVHQRPTTRMTMMRDEPQQQQQQQHHRQRCASQPPSSLMSGVEHSQIQRREAAVNWTPQLRTYTLHRPPTSPRRYIHDDDDDDAPTPTYPWHDDATPVRDVFVRTRSSSSKERASSSPSRTNSRAGRGCSRTHCVVDAQQQQQHIIDYAVELARGGGGGHHVRHAARQEPSPTPTRSCASRTSSTVHPHRGCSSTSSSSRRAVELDFARRQQAYADERHARLEAARQAEASAVHELCPFRPKLSVVSEALHAEQQQQHEKKKKKQRGNSCPAPRLLPSGRGAYMYFILSPRGGACLSGNVRSPRPKVPYTRYTSSQRLTNTPPPSPPPPPLHRHPHPSNIVSEDVSLMYRHNHQQQQQHWDPHPYDGSSPPPTPRCK